MSVDGISAVALLFMAALSIQSLPSLVRLFARVVSRKRRDASEAAEAAGDGDRLWNVGLSVAVGVLAVYAAHLGILAALGEKVAPAIDAAFTAIVLASGSDKISTLKDLIGVPGGAAGPPSTVEVSGKVTVSKSDAW
jgi:hypothetical protein